MPTFTQILAADEALDSKCQHHRPLAEQTAGFAEHPVTGELWTSGPDGDLLRFDPVTGAELGRIQAGIEQVHEIIFSPDGRAIVSDFARLLFFDGTGNPKGKIDAREGFFTVAVGSETLAGMDGEELVEWDLGTLAERSRTNVEDEIRVTRDGTDINKVLVVGGRVVTPVGADVIVWCDGEPDYVFSVAGRSSHYYGSDAWAGDKTGARFAEISDEYQERGCRVYDLDSGEVLAHAPTFQGGVLAFLSDDVLATWNPSSMSTWNWRTGEISTTPVPWLGHSDSLVLGSGERAVSSSVFGHFCSWDLQNMNPTIVAPAVFEQICLQPNGDGFVGAAGVGDGYVFSYVDFKGQVRQLASCEQSQTAVFWQDGHTVCLAGISWDGASELFTFEANGAQKAHAECECIAFARWGILKKGDDDQTVVELDAETLQPKETFRLGEDQWISWSDKNCADWISTQDDDGEDVMWHLASQTSLPGEMYGRTKEMMATLSWDSSYTAHLLDLKNREVLGGWEVEDSQSGVPVASTRSMALWDYEGTVQVWAPGEPKAAVLLKPIDYDDDSDHDRPYMTEITADADAEKAIALMSDGSSRLVDFAAKTVAPGPSFQLPSISTLAFEYNLIVAADDTGLFEVWKLDA